MKRIFLIMLCCGLLATGFTQNSSKKDNIKKLLEATGSGKLGVQAARTMITNFKKTYESVPDDFWNEIFLELNADTLVNLLIPIYDKYYSEEEIKQLSDFYATPLAKK